MVRAKYGMPSASNILEKTNLVAAHLVTKQASSLFEAVRTNQCSVLCTHVSLAGALYNAPLLTSVVLRPAATTLSNAGDALVVLCFACGAERGHSNNGPYGTPAALASSSTRASPFHSHATHRQTAPRAAGRRAGPATATNARWSSWQRRRSARPVPAGSRAWEKHQTHAGKRLA
jgi:hypothetical protein